MVWSDDLAELYMPGCTGILSLKLQCPSLSESETRIPPLRVIEQHVKPSHPPIAFVLKDTYGEAAAAAAEAKELEWKSLKEESVISKVYRGL